MEDKIKIGKVEVNRSEMARALGVDVAHISRIFSGKSLPSLELAVRIAGHMGISLDELCALLGLRPGVDVVSGVKDGSPSSLVSVG